MNHLGCRAVVLGGVGLLFGACGSGDSLGGEPGTASTGGASGGAPTGCEQGSTRPCLGPGACQGAQMCQSDRTWSTCDCGAPGSGGASPGGTGPALGGTPSSGGIGPGLGGTPSSGGIDPGLGGTPGTGGSGGLAMCPIFENLPPGSDCGASTTAVTPRQVNTLLVVDKSGSMLNVPAGFAQNKWISLTQALETVLTNTQQLMAYGLELFPANNVDRTCTTDCCQMPTAGYVDVAIPAGVQAIIDTLSTTLPGGGTPTAQALRSALGYFTLGSGSALVGKKVVILATDGGPNCNQSLTGCGIDVCTMNIDGNPAGCDASFSCCDPSIGQSAGLGCLDSDAVIAAIEDLAAAGIPTAVLGIPGTENYAAVMDAMAQAGGVPDPHGGEHFYYAANAAAGGTGLTQKIAEITAQLVNPCDLPLDPEPPDPDKVAVALDCVMLTRAIGDGGVGQWTLDTTTWTVKLLGDTCARVQQEGAARLDILYGCVSTIQ